MIGMQLRPIWERLDAPLRLHYCLVAAAVLGCVILTRIAWVMSYNTALRLMIARRGVRAQRAGVRDDRHAAETDLGAARCAAAAALLPCRRRGARLRHPHPYRLGDVLQHRAAAD